MKNVEPITARQIAELVGGRVAGNADVQITSLSSLEYAVDGSISFYGSTAFLRHLKATLATCVLLREHDVEHCSAPCMIVVDQPHQAFIRVIEQTESGKRLMKAGIDASAVVDDSATVHATAVVGPGCYVGKNCVIAEQSVLMANVVLYENVQIGIGTTVHANVTMYHDTVVGSDCIIHAGAVIGSDGFGYIENGDHSYSKIPQIGNVVIADKVEIGANVTIDRGALDPTIIEQGVKIDNLVHLAHGVVVCENTAIAALSGISGSTRLGQRNRIAGQVGIAGHLSTADDVVVLGQSGVTKTIKRSGVYSGTPAQEHVQQLRNDALIRDILSMKEQLLELAASITRLEAGEDV